MPNWDDPQSAFADVVRELTHVGYRGPVPLNGVAVFHGGPDIGGLLVGRIVGFEYKNDLRVHVSATHFQDYIVRWIRIHPRLDYTPAQGPFRTPASGNLGSNAAIYLTTLEGKASRYHLGWLEFRANVDH